MRCAVRKELWICCAEIAMKACAAQWIGTRPQQEDSYRVRFFPDGLLVVVCDGMGGHHHGGRAADKAADAFAEAFGGSSLTVSERMSLALQAANQAVGKLALECAQYGGTTLVAAYIGGGVVRWISVGDSALFLCRRGCLVRLNADHSMRPLFNRVELSSPAAANLLRSALTGESPELVDCSATPVPLLPDDRLILCTDGADGVLSPGKLADEARAVLSSRSGQEASELISLVCRAASADADNATILVVDI